MAWIFEPTPRMGGATGEAFSNVLHATGMRPDAVMAREAIQNSVDAFDPVRADKVEIRFRRISVHGNRKKQFVENLVLGNQIGKRKEFLGLQPDNCLEELGDPSKPLDLLYIEDFGTHGLYGDPHSSHSHFHRLPLSLGDSSKAWKDGASGGSYGYGKSVYSANSRIHTIVAYSVFNPQLAGDSDHARIMGCSYFKSHEFNGSEFTGRAWFGDPEKDQEGLVFPFTDERAHQVAEALGFSYRDRNSTGTSILIVDCPVEVDELRASIEEWWWPRILDDALDVVLHENEEPAPPPRPRIRSDLSPFIHCFDMAVGRSSPAGKQDKTGEFNRQRGVPLGGFGFTVLNGNEDELDQSKINSVALIRSPRMVVSYQNVTALSLPVVGCFVASDEVDQALKLSEPPAHDKWDEGSARFQKESQQDQVKTILNRIKTQLRQFANDAVPPTPKGAVRLGLLERMLGNMFKHRTTPGTGEGGTPVDPIEIQFLQEPQVFPDLDGLRTIGEFRIALAGRADREETTVVVEAQCVPVEDEGLSWKDQLKVELAPANGEVIPDGSNTGDGMVVFLTKGTRPAFSFRSERYPVDWTTRVFVMVKEVNQ